MSHEKVNRGRRRFAISAIAGVVAAPVLDNVFLREAAAEDLPHLSLDDPQAKGLQYVHDFEEAKSNPAHQEGAHCANCMHWTGEDADWGGCAIFPGKAVNRNGWCTAWAAKS